MELMSQEVILPNASPYQSVPASPYLGMQFHTAPSSPTKEVLGDDLFLDDFEFSTSRKFEEFIDLEINKNSEYFLENHDHQPQQQQYGKARRERGGSLPTMAFADELFYNGLVMPLKPPPRLQTCQENGDSFTQGSIPSSPRSPQHNSSFIKVPFVHKTAWNDDFDPFKAALQKVSEEGRGRASNAGGKHRRTRSHSPFRTSDKSEKWNRDQGDEAKIDEKLDDHQKGFGQKFGLPMEYKGSPYVRFVINQKKQVKEVEKGRRKIQKLQSGRRASSLRIDYKENGVAEGKNNAARESGMKKMRSIFLKYASFGRENGEEKAISNNQSSTFWKSNYFKKLSFKSKEKGTNENEKKRGIEEEEEEEEDQKIALEFKRNKPSFALCLGYGFEHHKNMNYGL